MSTFIQLARILLLVIATTAASAVATARASCPSPSSTIRTISGTEIFQPSGLDVAANGDIYYAHTGSFPWGLERLTCDGPVRIYGGNPGPIRVAPDGTLYLIEIDRNCCGNVGTTHVRRVDPFGVHSTVAGQPNVHGFSGDGGPASLAELSSPNDIAVDAQGVLYIADTGNNRIRRVGLDGIITTVAGTGQSDGPLGDGGPATLASLQPWALDVAPDGSLYVTELSHGNRIRRIDPSGTITTIAGGGDCIYGCDYRFPPCAENVPAAQACFIQPMRIRVNAAGSIFVYDHAYVWRIREITPDGNIRTLAGTGSFDITGEGGPASQAAVAVAHLAIGPDGSVYTAECTGAYCGNGRIRQIRCEGSLPPCTKCGNGTIDDGEECDGPGGLPPSSTCDSECRLSCPVPQRSARFQRDLAFHHAPIHYQDVDADLLGTPSFYWDYITRFNYDGNWRGDDNWNNLDAYVTRLRGYGYYSVVETCSHWYIIYAFFHPRDWMDLALDPSALGIHENDMEGLLSIVRVGSPGTELEFAL